MIPQTPWPLLLLASILALAGLGVIAIGLFRDPWRGLRRCSRCWYDLSGSQGLKCPECGVTHAREAMLHRRRRRWGLVAAGVFLLIIGGGLFAGRSRLRRVYYALMPTWELVQTSPADTCTVEIYRLRDPEGFHARLVVSHDGRVLADVNDYRLDWAVGTPITEDVTNDGVVDLVITGYSGGAHCCTTFTLISLGDQPALLATIDAPNGGVFERDPDTGEILYVSQDATFNYWKTSYASSASPRLVLRWQDGRFRVSGRHMQAPPPDAEALQAITVAARSAEYREKGAAPAELFGPVIEMIYQGNPDPAWALLKNAWDPAWGDHDVFRDELRAQLAKSSYWPEVRAIADVP